MTKKELICPYCKNDNQKMIEEISFTSPIKSWTRYLCHVCSKIFEIK